MSHEAPPKSDHPLNTVQKVDNDKAPMETPEIAGNPAPSAPRKGRPKGSKDRFPRYAKGTKPLPTPPVDTRLGPPPISAVGRPSEYARALARPYASEALATLVEIMRDSAAPAPSRVAAAVHILDRGFGKPKEIVEVTDETGARAALAGVSAAELKDLLRAVRAVDVTPGPAVDAQTAAGSPGSERDT